jgi:hypothetical protein
LSANINGVLIIQIQVDYKDKFSPNSNDNDEDGVRHAIEKLFKFKFKTKDDSHTLLTKTSLESSSPEKSRLPKEVEKEKNNEDIGLKKYLYIQFNRDDPLRLPSKRVF